MPRVIVVGAGFYGLIAAKTYLQVTGVYSSKSDKQEDDDDLLIIDSASDIGGTWAQERLYPNLLSQNSYGQYEYSDLSMATAVPNVPGEADTGQFIPGWKINRYLHIWCRKWDLHKRIRLNWKVIHVSRLPSKQWKAEIMSTAGPAPESITLLCDKLILATGLSSEPKIPKIPREGGDSIPEIHAKEIGAYFREKSGYRPIEAPETQAQDDEKCTPTLRTVAVYGGAKSSFDFIHLFGSLHRNNPSFRLRSQDSDPVRVHWIIREDGYGPAWMSPPISELPGGKRVPSDQAASTRLVGIVNRYVYEAPKTITWTPSNALWSWIPRVEGSWTQWLLRGNPLGRFLVSQFWKRIDKDIFGPARYHSQPKMERLHPATSVIESTTPGGIMNHSDLWDVIRGPNIDTYRSSIVGFSGPSSKPTIELADGTKIPKVDLIVYATGWKCIVPVQFSPPSLRVRLGLFDQPSARSSTQTQDQDWIRTEQEAEEHMRRVFEPAIFENRGPRHKATYRLFRRIASPALVAEGDRSLAVLGIVLSGSVAVVAEAQALWAAAFLTGGLDDDPDGEGPQGCPLSMTLEQVRRAVAEDVVWGRLTGVGLNLDAIKYNDMLMYDLGLNPYRMGGWWWRELMGSVQSVVVVCGDR